MFPRNNDTEVKIKAVKLLQGVDFEGMLFDLCRNANHSVLVVTVCLNIGGGGHRFLLIKAREKRGKRHLPTRRM